MALKLTFVGGAGKVTGSNFLVEGAKGKLLVDCGIEQGVDFCERCAHDSFPYDPKSIDALIVTHAHLDHVGRIPKLVKDGFKGKIYLTPPTRDLMEFILRDSAAIIAQSSAKKGLPPLYELGDVDATLSLTETLEYHVEKEAAPGLSIYLRDAGHILGSSSVRIKDEEGATVAFAGDIGNSPSPLLPDWEPIPDADALVMESVYGNRMHPPAGERVPHLRKTIARAIERGGAVLIPAFSLERTQLMLYELSNFFSAGELPRVPVFLDSPLAIKITAAYEKWGPIYFKREAQKEMKKEKSLFEFPFLEKTLAREESASIENVPNPKIIIAGAGMSHAGRIERWERRYLSDPKTTLLMVGYQAPGSPGRRLLEGARTIRFGEDHIPVRAEVELLEGWSAHADRDGLLEFAKAATPRAKVIFTALGEPAASRFLAQRIHDYLGARAVVPEAGHSWIVKKDSVARA